MEVVSFSIPFSMSENLPVLHDDILRLILSQTLDTINARRCAFLSLACKNLRIAHDDMTIPLTFTVNVEKAPGVLFCLRVDTASKILNVAIDWGDGTPIQRICGIQEYWSKDDNERAMRGISHKYTLKEGGAPYSVRVRVFPNTFNLSRSPGDRETVYLDCIDDQWLDNGKFLTTIETLGNIGIKFLSTLLFPGAVVPRLASLNVQPAKCRTFQVLDGEMRKVDYFVGNVGFSGDQSVNADIGVTGTSNLGVLSALL